MVFVKIREASLISQFPLISMLLLCCLCWCSPLLSDFTGIQEEGEGTKVAEKDVSIPYPFQIQVERMKDQ